MNQLDHVIIAAPDLEAAKRHFQDRTGIAPVDGGQHVGLGTRNALVSFGDGDQPRIVIDNIHIYHNQFPYRLPATSGEYRFNRYRQGAAGRSDSWCGRRGCCR